MQYFTKQQLLERVSNLDPKKYAKTRNHIDGSISCLSPYITHGVITTKQCVQEVLKKHSIKDAEKLLMELTWKEFFLQVQKSYGNNFVSEPIREDKTTLQRKDILPQQVYQAQTSTQRVNDTIQEMVTFGQLHNHQRMWLASRCSHRAKLERKKCADWTYYHFVDGELSTNHLSRQWVYSTFANKPYYMNEDNLQKYRPGTTDPDLRGSYDQVAERVFDLERPSQYRGTGDATDDVYTQLVTPLELIPKINLTSDLSQSLHTDTIRILSPWRLDETLLQDDIPTIVLLDEQFADQHPRSAKRIQYVQSYTDQVEAPLVYGSYNDTITAYLQQGVRVILDERRDPIYREAQQTFVDHEMVEILAYDWINTDHPQEPIIKFFKYRNKTKSFIKQLQS